MFQWIDPNHAKKQKRIARSTLITSDWPPMRRGQSQVHDFFVLKLFSWNSSLA